MSAPDARLLVTAPRPRDERRLPKFQPAYLVRGARPSHLALLLRDAVGARHRARPSSAHLGTVMEWLCQAQDASRDGGVAAAYSLLRGWEPPYPETTGYIIPTFLDYAAFSGRNEYRNRALRMGEWLLGMQLEAGAFQAGYYYGRPDPGRPSVFNTAQILLGLCRLFRETRDPSYEEAAVRAGDWLVQSQSQDGAWYHGLSFHGPNTPVRAYYVRVAWALMELAAIGAGDRYRAAAAAHVHWVLRQQAQNGWFRNNTFTVDRPPFTHTIAYVLEGLLGYAEHAMDQACVEAVDRTASRLMHLFEVRPRFPGEFDEGWKSTATYRCLTGEAQIAGVWLKLHALSGDARFLSSALKLLDRLKAVHDLASSNPAIRGGVKGSYPVWGRYHRLSLVSWGAKFLADALMAEIEVMRKLDGQESGR
jgi:uncharacterized protein YyaL (SSP411 family)